MGSYIDDYYPFDCNAGGDKETEEFLDQTPELDRPERSRTRRHYSPVIRVLASQLSQPLTVKAVYEHWCETGKIATKQELEGGGNNKETLLAAYQSGLEMSHARCADFCDAVLDALAQYLDTKSEYDDLLDNHTCKMVENMPDSNLTRPIIFYTALTFPPRIFHTRFHNKNFEHHLYAQAEEFPAGKKYYDIWDNFMLSNRCKFHDHPTGRCWRSHKVV